ncbi:LLM class flavin-dependent oxidoreductase [Candidatus Bathyarchaeota archaeon]|nr:LLM class flavin-dependent oxidoreductase [Candidatus Bathyarchaeota archaeon]
MNDVKFSFYFQQDNPLMGKVIEERGFDFLRYTTEKAEELGFRTVFYPDHFMLPKNKTLLSCWCVLSALAEATEKIRLCSLVTPIPLYPIHVLLKNIVTVDNISKGRVMFGVGAGWYGREFDAYNIRFPKLRERVEMVEEAIKVFKALCEEEGPVTFKGKYYRLDEALFYPKPVQKPHPPIWTGGSSNRILTLTAKYAQGWIPYEQPLDAMKTKIGKLRRLLVENGRREDEVEVGMSFRCVVSDKREEVEEVMKRLDLRREFVNVIGVRSRIIAGTTEEVIEELRSYMDVGVKHFCFGMQPSHQIPEKLELVRDKVITQL